MKKQFAAVLVVFVAALMSFTTVCRAQTPDPAPDVPKPDLSGSWKLNLDKSNMGRTKAPVALIETISQSGTSEITFQVRRITEQGEVKFHYTLQIGGPVTGIPTNTFSPDDDFKIQDAQASWAADSLIVTYNATYKKTQMTLVSHYTLSRDGGRLTRATNIDEDAGPDYTVEIFDKD